MSGRLGVECTQQKRGNDYVMETTTARLLEMIEELRSEIERLNERLQKLETRAALADD